MGFRSEGFTCHFGDFWYYLNSEACSIIGLKHNNALTLLLLNQVENFKKNKSVYIYLIHFSPAIYLLSSRKQTGLPCIILGSPCTDNPSLLEEFFPFVWPFLEYWQRITPNYLYFSACDLCFPCYALLSLPPVIYVFISVIWLFWIKLFFDPFLKFRGDFWILSSTYTFYLLIYKR